MYMIIFKKESLLGTTLPTLDKDIRQVRRG